LAPYAYVIMVLAPTSQLRMQIRGYF